jgi:Zn2+/Cd2+-exporting ATPase
MSTAAPLPDDMKRRLTGVFFAAAFLLAGAALPWLRPGQETIGSLLALTGLLIVGLPIVKQTFSAMRATGFAATQFYMDQYVVIAIGACLATGQYITGGVVAVVLVLGQMLEERTVIGVEYALRRLRELSQVRARRLRLPPTTAGSDDEELVDAQTLRPGERVRIRPGDAVPADACIESGESLVNQSAITGESLPADVRPGSRIFAGTTNLTGLLEATVLETGDDTVMARVTRILEEAKETEAPIIRMAEDYARYYTPLVLLIAASVFFFTQDINRAIAVLIVSIPCAFVLASPSALVTAIACASRLGLLVKGARHFEEGRRIDTVVFDKTGTLTEGVLHVENVWLHAETTREQVLTYAAALERHSNHPVARAIVDAAASSPAVTPSQDAVTALQEVSGRGVQAKVDGHFVRVGRPRWLAETGATLAPAPENADRFSLVAVVVDDVHVATIGLADRLRAEAPEALERLRLLGVERFVLLTGDRRPVAATIAARLGLTDFEAECLPEDKARRIEALKKSGARVMVVGDGLNDAPALAAGHVGVAMGALGNDVAIATADVALMNNDLRRLADLLELSHRTVGTINQNLLCGFAFIILAVTLSALGFVTPVVAAFFHEFSAFFVIFNSARLLRFDGLAAAPASGVSAAPLPAPQPA